MEIQWFYGVFVVLFPIFVQNKQDQKPDSVQNVLNTLHIQKAVYLQCMIWKSCNV